MRHQERSSNRDFDLDYGAAQWHASWLERMGFVKTVRIDKRRYVSVMRHKYAI